MKILSIISVIVALVLIGFNITYIDLDNPFSGNSMVAIIAIVAALCALMLLALLYVSRKINDKLK
ncbi:hypothetical protein ACILD6_08645 [Capnocytophaga canimorsus]|uniref:hypothetical protein n=1 Tax=Capnocytophaga canimorsus TaxID=28188 RepID=UPI0037CE8225